MLCFLWVYATKKIPAGNAGTKTNKKRKPAAHDLLTAGVGSIDKKDARYKRERQGKRKN